MTGWIVSIERPERADLEDIVDFFAVLGLEIEFRTSTTNVDVQVWSVGPVGMDRPCWYSAPVPSMNVNVTAEFL